MIAQSEPTNVKRKQVKANLNLMFFKQLKRWHYSQNMKLFQEENAQNQPLRENLKTLLKFPEEKNLNKI